MHLYSGTFSKGSALDFKVHFLRIIDFQGHVLGRQGEWEERGGKKGQESKAIPRTISGVRRGEKRWKFYSDVTRICRLVLVFFCCVKDFFTFSRLARMIFKITAKLFLVKNKDTTSSFSRSKLPPQQLFCYVKSSWKSWRITRGREGGDFLKGL